MKIKVIVEPTIVLVGAGTAFKSTTASYTTYNSAITVNGTLVRTFEDDANLAKAKEWVNTTYAPKQTAKLKAQIEELNKKLTEHFLVPVEVEVSTSK